MVQKIVEVFLKQSLKGSLDIAATDEVKIVLNTSVHR